MALLAHVASAGPSTTTTAPINTVGAGLIVVAVAYETNNFIGLTDSLANTWTPLTIQNDGTFFCRLYYCLNPTTGAAHTFSGANSYPVPIELCVQASSGAFTFVVQTELPLVGLA